jgi:hypothetical protein
MAILDLIASAYPATLVIMLPKELKYSTFSAVFYLYNLYGGWLP